MGTAQVQGEMWGAAAEDWAALQEPSGTPLYEATYDALGLGNGTRLLDVGCGAGLAAQLAAKRGALVSAIDASTGLLAVARRRATDVDWRQGDLEDLPYEY
jgi:ubiquinone/menaquinone biosynthesis C-methylase UbiE